MTSYKTKRSGSNRNYAPQVGTWAYKQSQLQPSQSAVVIGRPAGFMGANGGDDQ